VHFIFTNIRSY